MVPNISYMLNAMCSTLTGSVMRLTIPGTEILVLNTHEAVQDLFMKRSTIYSDRPRMVVIREV